MSENDDSSLFSPGASFDSAPAGDLERQALSSLRGYNYQIAVSTLAWLDLDEKTQLYLEVAEDYATVANNALSAVQIKDTAGSGPVTINSQSVRDAITNFIQLVTDNPKYSSIELRYLSTSPIGIEKSKSKRAAEDGTLNYWRRAATGSDVKPVKEILDSDSFPDSVRQFVQSRDDDALRGDLLRKIHWDCGSPDTAAVRRELEERLAVLCRDRFNIPATEVGRLADVLSYGVLKQSIQKDPQARMLNRGALYVAIDAASRVSVPRAAVESFSQIGPAIAAAMAGAFLTGEFAGQNIDWLIEGSTLPKPRLVISRQTLEREIVASITKFGTAILVGGTGFGKTLVARAVASSFGNYMSADFRDNDTAEDAYRLNLLLGRVGSLSTRTLILEDLNHIDESQVLLSLARVVESVRRRDRINLITSYRRPSVRSLAELGIDAEAVIDVPYFSEEEVGELVRVAGGDPKIWGRLAHITGAQGHPQLVHAFVLGMAARNWPKTAARDVVHRGLTSQEIDTERDVARRSIAEAMPDDVRTLLYRLSMAIGRFDRALAIAIAGLKPRVKNAAELLDQLVGPWIEALGENQYRISPLASNFGRDSLSAADQIQIHKLISTQLLSRRKINVSEASTILTHALVGKSEDSLIAIAYSVIQTGKESLETLSEQFFLLRMLRTDQLIYPENHTVSRILRLAQLRLVTTKGDSSEIQKCVAALLSETGLEKNKLAREAFELMAIATVVSVIGIADHLPNWVDLIARMIDLFEGHQPLKEIRDDFNALHSSEGLTFFGVLFPIGTGGVSSISRLEEIINEMDRLSEKKRALLLETYKKRPDDYGILINGPWLAETREKGIDVLHAKMAADSYARMAEVSTRWGERALAVRCYVAQAVMLDEYAKDGDAGLRSLEAAESLIGNDIQLSRERAKILWRRDDNLGAINILRDIADVYGRDNPIERTFALREAAISAAKLDDWPQARKWLDEAQSAAKTCEDLIDMTAMAIGLSADAGVAAFKSGDNEGALRRFSACLTALKQLDPEASLRTAYCHRVARHTVMWFQSQFKNRKTLVDGKPIEMLPGACSNPEPPEAIREMKLGPYDYAWYLLAEAEILSGCDVGIDKNLDTELSGARVTTAEFSLRYTRMTYAVSQLDANKFAVQLQEYLESSSYMNANRTLVRNEDIFDLVRVPIPRLPPDAAINDQFVRDVAVDGYLAFCITAAFKNQFDKIAELEAALKATYGHNFVGSEFFGELQGHISKLAHLDRTCADAIRLLTGDQHLEPKMVWVIGLRLFEKLNRGNFKTQLIPILADWLRKSWTRILDAETFRLYQPILTLPKVQTALSNPVNDDKFIANLLVVTADAVGTDLAQTYRDHLIEIATAKSQQENR